MAVKTLTYVLLGRDQLSPVAKKAGAETEASYKRMGTAASASMILVAAAAGAFVAESVKSAVTFQASMEKIHTQAGASQKSVELLTQSVLNMGLHAQQSPEELANALYHLKSVGMDNVDAMKALKQASDLAAVGGANLEETTNALAGAWRSGIKGAQSFGQTASTVNAIIGAGNMRMEDFVAAIGTGILPSAKTFGVSLSSIGSALALMTDEGVPAVDAATRLRMSLSLLGAPSGKAEKVLKTIGLTGLDLAQTMRSPAGLIGAISLLKKHLDDSGLSASEQAQVLSHAFGGGRSSSGILTLINNLDVLKKKQEQINGTIGNFGPAVAAQSKTAQAQLALLRSAFDVLSIRVGTALLPPLVKFAQFINATAIPALMHFFDEIRPAAQVAFGYFITGLTTIAHAFNELPGPVKIGIVAIVAFGVAMRLAAAANPWILLATAIVLAVGAIVKNWKTIGPVFNAVKNGIMTGWHDVVNFITKSFNDTRAFVIGVWHSFEDSFPGKIIIALVKFMWADVVIQFQVARDIIVGVFNVIAAIAKFTWTVLYTSFKIIWDNLLYPIFVIVKTIITSTFDAIAKVAQIAWKIISTAWVWQWQNILKPAIEILWTTISTVFGWIIHGAASAFGWIPGIGGGLKSAAKAFDNFRDQVNAAINGVQGKTVNVNVGLTPIGTGPLAGKPLATGGRITGPGGPRDDKAGLFALSNNEWVIRASSAQGYGHAAMDAVNRGTAVIGYAGGGEVSIHPGTPSASSISSTIGGALKKVVQNAVNEGLLGGLGGLGSSILSYTSQFIGRAPYIWGGDTPSGWDCSGMVSYIYDHFGLYHGRTTAAGFQNWASPSAAQPGGMVFFGNPAYHVGLVIDNNRMVSALGKQFGTIISGSGGNSGYGIPPGGLPGIGQGPPGAGGAGNANYWVNVGREMAAQYGWTGGTFQDLFMLWQQESGWNPYAVNPSSGAYGIPQALGHGHPYNLGDGVAQIAWGLNYIKGRYGSPLGAWAHEIFNNWYADGGPIAFDSGFGVLRPGHQIVYNGTGKNEALSAAGGGQRVYHITVNVPPTAHPAETGRQVVKVIKEYEKSSGAGWRK